MGVVRCPECDTVLTEVEVNEAGGSCPECAAALPGGHEPEVVEATPPAPRSSRGGFLRGVVVGSLVALAAAAGAWWGWRPGPPPAVHSDTAAPIVPVTASAPPKARTEPASSEAVEAAVRLSCAWVQLAVAEQDLAAAEARQRAAIAQPKSEPADRTQLIKQEQEAIRRAQTQRADAERALAEANNRLQTARTQVTDLDRQIQDRKTKLTEGDRNLEGRRAELGGVERALAARRVELAELERTLRGKTAPAVARAADGKAGFIRNWLVVGPFPAPDRKGHDAYFAPQAGAIETDKEFKGTSGSIRWQAHASPADYIDFAGLYKTQDPAVAYAVCWVKPAKAGRAQLRLGSNDGIQVWVNGKRVADRPVSRSASPDQDRADCELTADWNELRVKIDNQGGPWGFYFDLREAAADKPLGNLEFRTTPPYAKAKK